MTYPSLANLRGKALTPTEKKVLEHYMAGLTTRGIARQLIVSVKTVDTHRANIIAKLGALTLPHAVSNHLTDERRRVASAGVAY